MLKLGRDGLIPTIVQDANTGQVLMLGYMNPESLDLTLKSGEVWFYSRSRADLWHKGESSGNYMKLKSSYGDCDGDTILLQVDPAGPSCHTENTTCFFNAFDKLPEFVKSENGPEILEELYSIIEDRKTNMPEDSYTSQLLREGKDRISQKIIEEAGESAIAGAKGNKKELVNEVADLLYHTLVLLSALDIKPSKIWEQLRLRRK